MLETVGSGLFWFRHLAVDNLLLHDINAVLKRLKKQARIMLMPRFGLLCLSVAPVASLREPDLVIRRKSN